MLHSCKKTAIYGFIAKDMAIQCAKLWLLLQKQAGISPCLLPNPNYLTGVRWNRQSVKSKAASLFLIFKPNNWAAQGFN